MGYSAAERGGAHFARVACPSIEDLTMTRTAEAKAETKHKLILEGKKLLAIAVYLYFTMTAMDFYKASILDQPVLVGFKLGYNGLEALLFAKVVLIGDLLGLGERFRGYPAIVPTVAKSFAFALFVAAFSMLEVLVEHLFHGSGLQAALNAVASMNRWTMGLHIGIMFFFFLPLFATWELARVDGEEKFIDMFFTRPKAG